jgi:DNA-binding NarL/FixJ family response regulator
VREGLAAILGTDPEIEIEGLASNGREALELVEEIQPDVVLMDLKMPVMNGVQATQHLSRSHPDVQILVLTTYADDQWVLDAIRAGAAGYLLKDTRRDALLDAVKGTVAGRTYLDPTIAGMLTRQVSSAPDPVPSARSRLEDFTEREQEVLYLLAQGHSNPEIADRLHLARGTVRNYVSAILQKLGVSDRTQAAVVAVQHGLLESLGE